jgi:hypothetical protein
MRRRRKRKSDISQRDEVIKELELKLDAENCTEDARVEDVAVIFQSVFQKSVSSTGIKLFNRLPLSLTQLANDSPEEISSHKFLPHRRGILFLEIKI